MRASRRSAHISLRILVTTGRNGWSQPSAGEDRATTTGMLRSSIGRAPLTAGLGVQVSSKQRKAARLAHAPGFKQSPLLSRCAQVCAWVDRERQFTRRGTARGVRLSNAPVHGGWGPRWLTCPFGLWVLVVGDLAGVPVVPAWLDSGATLLSPPPLRLFLETLLRLDL